MRYKTESIKAMERKVMSLEREIENIEMNELFDFDEYKLYDPDNYNYNNYDLYSKYYYKVLEYDVAITALSILIN